MEYREWPYPGICEHCGGPLGASPGPRCNLCIALAPLIAEGEEGEREDG